MTRRPLAVEPLEPRDVPSTVLADEPAAPMPTAGPAAEVAVVEHAGRAGAAIKGLPRGRLAVGSAEGRPATVAVFDAHTAEPVGTLLPFGPAFTGGARVAAAELTGDAVEDVVVAAGPGTAPLVKVYDGKTLAEVGAFVAYADGFAGGVFVAAGDVTGDGRADVVTGAGAGGGPHVQVFDGANLFPPGGGTPAAAHSFFAYAPGFAGGLTVAVGDVNADGFGDVVTGAGPGGGPHVQVFGGRDRAVLASFFAYDPEFRGGVHVTAGDLTGDGRAEVATGPMAGGGPHLRAFDPAGAPTANACPFDYALRCGAAVAAKDVDGDGRAELVAATGPGTPPAVKVLAGPRLEPVRDLSAVTAGFDDGLFVG